MTRWWKSLMTLLARLDAFGADDPDNNEGFYEDRCGVCEWPVMDHVGRGGTDAAKWPHRWHALIDMTIRRWP